MFFKAALNHDKKEIKVQQKNYVFYILIKIIKLQKHIITKIKIKTKNIKSRQNINKYYNHIKLTQHCFELERVDNSKISLICQIFRLSLYDEIKIEN